MGNYSELYLTNHFNHTTPAEELNYNNSFCVKHRIPIFWLALFSPLDIHHTHQEINDDDSYYYFIAPKEQCLQIFNKRIQTLSFWFNPQIQELGFCFYEFISRLDYEYIVLRVDDILSAYLGAGSSEAKMEMMSLLNRFESLASVDDPIILAQNNIPILHDAIDLLFRFDIDGFGHEQLPCPAVDDWLEQNQLKLQLAKKQQEDNLDRFYANRIIQPISNIEANIDFETREDYLIYLVLHGDRQARYTILGKAAIHPLISLSSLRRNRKIIAQTLAYFELFTACFICLFLGVIACVIAYSFFITHHFFSFIINIMVIVFIIFLPFLKLIKKRIGLLRRISQLDVI